MACNIFNIKALLSQRQEKNLAEAVGIEPTHPYGDHGLATQYITALSRFRIVDFPSTSSLRQAQGVHLRQHSGLP